MSGAKGRFHRVLWCEIEVLNSVSEGEFSMRRILLCGLTVFAFCALLSTVALAGSHNPADYPLRVNIFHHSSYSHYYGPSGIRSLNDVDGEGRANLLDRKSTRLNSSHLG